MAPTVLRDDEHCSRDSTALLHPVRLSEEYAVLVRVSEVKGMLAIRITS